MDGLFLSVLKSFWESGSFCWCQASLLWLQWPLRWIDDHLPLHALHRYQMLQTSYSDEELTYLRYLFGYLLPLVPARHSGSSSWSPRCWHVGISRGILQPVTLEHFFLLNPIFVLLAVFATHTYTILWIFSLELANLPELWLFTLAQTLFFLHPLCKILNRFFRPQYENLENFFPSMIHPYKSSFLISLNISYGTWLIPAALLNMGSR